jgi:hypothetical protein
LRANIDGRQRVANAARRRERTVAAVQDYERSIHPAGLGDDLLELMADRQAAAAHLLALPKKRATQAKNLRRTP